MNLSPEAEAIHARLKTFVKDKNFALNPDPERLEKILNGLARQQQEHGRPYCFCRLVTGNEEIDRKIVCPCAYHEQELAERGACHCKLFVKEKDTSS